MFTEFSVLLIAFGQSSNSNLSKFGGRNSPIRTKSASSLNISSLFLKRNRFAYVIRTYGAYIKTNVSSVFCSQFHETQTIQDASPHPRQQSQLLVNPPHCLSVIPLTPPPFTVPAILPAVCPATHSPVCLQLEHPHKDLIFKFSAPQIDPFQ